MKNNDGRFHDYMKGYMVGSSLGNSHKPNTSNSYNAPSDLRSVVSTLLGWAAGGVLAIIILALLGR